MGTDFATTVRQLVCGLQGHENLLEFGRGRLSLKCISCGHETPGWDLRKNSIAAPASTSPTIEPARWKRLLPHFAGARRLA
jgi:hypothetical protein